MDNVPAASNGANGAGDVDFLFDYTGLPAGSDVLLERIVTMVFGGLLAYFTARDLFTELSRSNILRTTQGRQRYRNE